MRFDHSAQIEPIEIEWQITSPGKVHLHLSVVFNMQMSKAHIPLETGFALATKRK